MKKIAFAVVALLATSVASAANNSFYATVDYTAHELTVDNRGSADFGSVGFAGGYQFNEFIAAEARVSSGANDQQFSNGVSFGLNSYIGAQAVATFPLGQSFSLYGTLGYGRAELQATQGNVQVTDNDTSVTYGGGLQYNFGQFGARVGYESLYDKEDVSIDGFKFTGIYSF